MVTVVPAPGDAVAMMMPSAVPAMVVPTRLCGAGRDAHQADGERRGRNYSLHGKFPQEFVGRPALNSVARLRVARPSSQSIVAAA